MKPVFPSIKKNVKSFLYDEDGLITKDSLIKLGVLSVGVIAASTPAVAAIEYELTCEDTLEAGDYTMHILIDDTGASGDMMDGDKCKFLADGYFAFEDRVVVTNGLVPDDIDDWEAYGDCEGGGAKIRAPVIFDRPLHRHSNGLSMSAEDDVLEASHSHSLEPVCTEYPRYEIEVQCCKGQVGTRQNPPKADCDCSSSEKKGLHIWVYQYNEYGDLSAETGKMERCVPD